MKKCSLCKTEKALSRFEKDNRKPSGYGSRCRTCRQNHNNPAWQQAYREHNREAERTRRRRNRKANATVETMKDKMRYGTEKVKARAAIRNAVQAGKVIKPHACEGCGDTLHLLHAHHEDYAKPFDVQWLCSICHGLVHRKNKGSLEVQNLREENSKLRAALGEALYALCINDYEDQQAVAAKLKPLLNEQYPPHSENSSEK